MIITGLIIMAVSIFIALLNVGAIALGRNWGARVVVVHILAIAGNLVGGIILLIGLVRWLLEVSAKNGIQF